MDNVINLKPKKVFIMGGINDAKGYNIWKEEIRNYMN